MHGCDKRCSHHLRSVTGDAGKVLSSHRRRFRETFLPASCVRFNNRSAPACHIRPLAERVVAIVAFLLIALPAIAWNDTGHETVAEIAWQNLSQSRRDKISTLLLQHPHYRLLLATNVPSHVDTNEWVFLKAATWPDMVRPTRGTNHAKPAFITAYHHADWHYTNAPYIAPADLGTVLPPGQPEGKILEALSANQAIVNDKTQPATNLAVALCWLLHLIGDIHQPLHCVARFSAEFPDGDRGGNLEAIRPLTSAVVLHAWWDDLLGTGVSYKTIHDHATNLVQDPDLARSQLKELRHKKYSGWAAESIAAARTNAYLEGQLNFVKIPGGDLNNVVDAAVPPLNPGYEINATTLARRRTSLAGRRLADVLKNLF